MTRLNLYRHSATDAWKFDDASLGIISEPFVCGASEAIDALGDLPPTARAAVLEFSDREVVGFHEVVQDQRQGDWTCYLWRGRQAWLCPCLLQYFEDPPASLWVKVMAA